MDEAASFASIDLEARPRGAPRRPLLGEPPPPTQDPRLLGDRERAETRWNDQYGKVLSGTGTEEEIKAFFDHRMQLSSDSVRFVDWVIEHQGDGSRSRISHCSTSRSASTWRASRKSRGACRRPSTARPSRTRRGEAWLAEQREFEAEGGEAPPARMTSRRRDDVP